jgi:caffeoyl-CoA O-methyltransferase
MATVAKSRPVTPVGILAARLERLAARIEPDTPLDAALKAELDEVAALAGGLDPYLSRCTTPESPALRALAERTRAIDWSHPAGDGAAPGAPALEAEMLSGHVEGQVLKFLVAIVGATRVLEIGMFTGYSALAMAEALPEDGELVACELDPEVAAFAQRCFAESPSGGRIAVEVGPALATLARLATAGRAFELVFIDADKAGYRDYLDAVLGSGLLAPGGVICIDNTLMQGEPYLDGEPSPNGEAIAAFNDGLADDPRVEQVLLPLRDGLTLVRRV